MKVIFLDFNGVLDTHENMDEINYDNLMRLKRIVSETNAKIVISSSLKNHYYRTGELGHQLTHLMETLNNHGMEVVGLLPKGRTREEEIKQYLEEHKEIEAFCILDDDYEMEALNEHVVKLPNQMEKTSKGLEEMHVKQAIMILNQPQKVLVKR